MLSANSDTEPMTDATENQSHSKPKYQEESVFSSTGLPCGVRR
jgi:hypothetical protein